MQTQLATFKASAWPALQLHLPLESITHMGLCLGLFLDPHTNSTKRVHIPGIHKSTPLRDLEEAHPVLGTGVGMGGRKQKALEQHVKQMPEAARPTKTPLSAPFDVLLVCKQAVLGLPPFPQAIQDSW